MLPRATKISASFLLVLAVCGSLSAVLRAIYTHTLDFGKQYYDRDHDHHQTYYQESAAVIDCAVLELGLGISAASLACVRPLFQRWNLIRLIRSVSRTVHLTDVECGTRIEALGVPLQPKLTQTKAALDSLHDSQQQNSSNSRLEESNVN